MASKVSIANKALSLLGQSGITSFSDKTSRSDAISEVYDDILREVLEETEWNFSTKRSVLAQAVVTIPWTADGLIIPYLYPSDAIRILNLSDDNLIWKVEVIGTSKFILTDMSSLEIRYIFLNTDPSQYSPKFIKALATRLAAELAYQINRDMKEYAQRIEIYEKVELPKAISANSQEGSTTQPKQDKFILAKFGAIPPRAGRYYG